MFKKRKLYFIFIFSTLIIILSAGIYFLYFTTNIERLQSHYPVYSKKNGHYILVSKKPSHWVELKDISEYAKWAIVVSEDWAFFDHIGVDLNQILVVVQESYAKGRLIRGASTITQQVVKNSVLTNERSLWRKFKEVILSLKLERFMSKNKILEIYLNLAEFGPDIYGIGDAGLYYFNKHPRSLSAKEGSFLAMLLPSPVKYHQSFEKKELTPFAKEQVAKILIKLRQAKVINEEIRSRENDKSLSFEKSDESLIERDYWDSFFEE